MPPKQERMVLRLAVGALGITWGYTIWSSLQLKEGYDRLKDEYLTLYARVHYMMIRLEEEGVELDDIINQFDLIALRNLDQSEYRGE